MGNYLVTGVAGFIGSAIVRALLRRGDNVRGLDDFSTGKRENIAELKGDLDFREVSLLRSEEHTSELQSHLNLVCRLLLEIGRASCRERV